MNVVLACSRLGSSIFLTIFWIYKKETDVIEEESESESDNDDNAKVL